MHPTFPDGFEARRKSQGSASPREHIIGELKNEEKRAVRNPMTLTKPRTSCQEAVHIWARCTRCRLMLPVGKSASRAGFAIRIISESGRFRPQRPGGAARCRNLQDP